MKILSVHIDRFGVLSDRTFEMSPGFTVFYGPNESGKTSAMEFIRTALVPSPQRNRYPKYSKTDSGTLTVDDDKIIRRIELVGRNHSGDIPECISDLDPYVFRTIFAMGASELNSDDTISSGDIRSRFLMMPGGEVMPRLLKEFSDESDSILGKTVRSNSELTDIDARLSEINAKIKSLKESFSAYGRLDAQKRNLIDEERRLTVMSEQENSQKVSAAIYESNQNNIVKLRDLEEQLRNLGEFIVAGYDERSMFDRLSEKKRDSSDALFRAEKEYKDSAEGLRNFDSLCECADELILLPDRLRVHGQSSGGTGTVYKRNKAVATAGLFTAVAGAVFSVYNPIALVLVPIGTLIALIGLRKKKINANTNDNDELRTVISAYMKRFGFEEKGAEADAKYLAEAARKARVCVDSRRKYEEAEVKATEDSDKLSEFLQPYGGEEGFEIAVQKTKKSMYLKERIESLKEILGDSAVDSDAVKGPLDSIPEDYQQRLAEISRKIGALDAEMKRIMESDELDNLIDAREALMSKRMDVLRRGAESVIKKRICEIACGEAYDNMKPGVTQTADRYLSMMTSGRYRLVSDPREKSISVSEGNNIKQLDRCSSGLRAQILLSLKLSIAKELGNGKIPMILDDVTLPFDSERKAGAVKALSEISEEMQVIMFTCDRETYDLCRLNQRDGIVCTAMNGER